MPDSNPVGLREMIKAGVVGNLVNYWHSIGGRESDWPRVEVYAMREFRAVSVEVIRSTVSYARNATRAAAIQMGFGDGDASGTTDMPTLRD